MDPLVNHSLGQPHLLLDGPACVVLAGLLAPVVEGLDHLAPEVRAVLQLVGETAAAARAGDAARLAHDGVTADGYVSTAELARLLGVSQRAIVKRISSGTLAAHRRGRAWLVDPSSAI